MKTIYIYLLDEGVDVWRPVEAERMSSTTFRIPSTTNIPDDESWMFKPGEVVRCEIRRLADGERLVAIQRMNG